MQKVKCIICGKIESSGDYVIIIKNERNGIEKKAYLCSKCFYNLLYTTKETKHY